jgi:predicted acetyltransferase
LPEVKACYDAHAPRHDGTLARGDYIWNRIRKWRDAVYTGFATRDASGRIDGYLFMNQKRKDNGKMDLALSDFCGLSASAYRRLLGFLADFAMMADTATFHAGPHHPALMLLPQQSFEIKHHEFWMFRVLDVKRAMELRGWPRGVAAEISLDVNDPLLDANHGRWVLRVRDGKAAVERGGDGAIRIDVRGLAPLLTGLQSVQGLVLGGLAEARDVAIRDAAAVFPGGMPWTGDFY